MPESCSTRENKPFPTSKAEFSELPIVEVEFIFENIVLSWLGY
jgi:hypothetical protein